MTTVIRILRNALAPRGLSPEQAPAAVTRAEIANLFGEELYR